MKPKVDQEVNEYGTLHALSIRRPASVRLLINVVLLSLTVMTSTTFGQSSASREYKVKVAYLYNFSKYVTWPPESFSSKTAPFIIGILGPDPFGATLDAVAASKKANDRVVTVKRFETIEQYEHCHILFVAGETQSEIHSQVLTKTRGLPVMVIGEAKGFAQDGGTVEFFNDSNDTIGFSINIDSVKRQNLVVQAQVLKIASIVNDRTTLTGVKK
jgi:hypothetical protein